MKKLTAILLAVMTAFALAACSGNNVNTETEAPKPESTVDSTGTEADSSDTSKIDSSSEPSDDDSADKAKILVAYFSATNTTEGVAKTIADSIGADLYEITPEQPYTADDLDYHDDKSRSTIEMNDPSARPAISGSVENMEQYDIVFIGYPIWWGEAPRIINTFVESYSFSDKTIVPFCTSGGSGIGSSAKNLEGLTSGAEWLSGTRLRGNASKEDVIEWIDGLGLDITAQ